MEVLTPRDYFYINNINDIGNANVYISFNYYHDLNNYNPKKLVNEILFPVFKVVNSENKLLLQAGYIDRETNFFLCPITIFYLSIYDINYNASSQIFETSVKVFDKNIVQYKIKKIYGKDGDSIQGSLHNLIKILNLLNIYIEKERNVDEIIFEKIRRRNLYYKSKSDIILEAVNGLSIQFFETGIYVPQKDNSFFIDAEIANLPNNQYLKQLLHNYLLSANTTSIIEIDDSFIIVYQAERYALPGFSRRYAEENESLVSNLKDKFKIDLAQNFNILEYKLARLIED